MKKLQKNKNIMKEGNTKMHKKHLLFIALAVVLLLAALSLNSFADSPPGEGKIPVPAGYDIERNSALVTLPNLAAGQVWAGKQVETLDPVNAGEFRITLYAWGRTFTDDEGRTQNPLAPETGVTITDTLGPQFEVKDPAALPANVIVNNGVATWTVGQDAIVANAVAPQTISFTVKLKAGWENEITYYTNAAAAAYFTPQEGNPYYYWLVDEDTVHYEVKELSWNMGQGGGINRLSFVDYDFTDANSNPFSVTVLPSNSLKLGGSISIPFDGNNYLFTLISAEDVNKVFDGITFVRLYTFSLTLPSDPSSPSITYEVYVDNNGGANPRYHYGKTTTSTTYQRTKDRDWDGDTANIHTNLPNRGDITMSYSAFDVYVKTWYSDDDGMTYTAAGEYVLFDTVIKSADYPLILNGSLLPGSWTNGGKSYDFVKYSYDSNTTFLTIGYTITDVNGDIYIDRYYKRFECEDIKVTKTVSTQATVGAQPFVFELYYMDGNDKIVVGTATINTNATDTATFSIDSTGKDLVGKTLWIGEIIPENIFTDNGVWIYDATGMNGKAMVSVAANGAVTYSTAPGAWFDTPITFTNNFYAAVYDIAVSKTSNQSAAEDGDTIVYSVRVDNTGNVPLTGIKLNDTLLGTDLLSGEVTIYDKASCQQADEITNFTLYKTLGPNAGYIIYYKYTVLAENPKNLTNMVTATTEEGAEDEDTNVVTVKRPIITLVKLVYDKSQDKFVTGAVTLKHGETAIYEIEVKNEGDATSGILSLHDLLTGPDGFSENLALTGGNADSFTVSANSSVKFYAEIELSGMTFAEQDQAKIDMVAAIADKEEGILLLANALSNAQVACYEADLAYGEALSELERLYDADEPDETAVKEAKETLTAVAGALEDVQSALQKAQTALDEAEEELSELNAGLEELEAGVYSKLEYVNTAILGDLSSTARVEVEPEEYKSLRIQKLVKADGAWKNVAILNNGDMAEFKVTVTNTGNTVISFVKILDAMEDAVGKDVVITLINGDESASDLAPGRSFTAYYKSEALSNDSIEEGKLYKNVASCDDTEDYALLIVAPQPAARLAISKKVWNGAGEPNTEDYASWLKNTVRYVEEAENTVDFYFMITLKNLGKVAATVDLADKFGDLDAILLNDIGGDEINKVTIAAGATQKLYFKGTAAVGKTVNTASYTTTKDSNPSFNPEDESSATVEVIVIDKVLLSIDKKVVRIMKSPETEEYVEIGDYADKVTIASNDPVEFAYKITINNASETTTGKVSLSDAFSNGDTPAIYTDLSFETALTPSELKEIEVLKSSSVTFYVYLDLAAGESMTNTVNIEGVRDGSEGIADKIVAGESEATATVEQHPVLSVSKEIWDEGNEEWTDEVVAYSNGPMEFRFRIIIGNSGPVGASVQLSDFFAEKDVTADLEGAIDEEGYVTVPAKHGETDGMLVLYYTGLVPSGATYINDVEIVDEEPRDTASAEVKPLLKSILNVQKLAAFADALSEDGEDDPYAATITRITDEPVTVIYMITVTNSGGADGLFTLEDKLEGVTQILYTEKDCQNEALADENGCFTVEAESQRVFYAKAVVYPVENDIATTVNTVVIAGARDGENDEHTEDIIDEGESEAKVIISEKPFATVKVEKKVKNDKGEWVDTATFSGTTGKADFKITVSLDVRALEVYNEMAQAYNENLPENEKLPLYENAYFSGRLSDVFNGEAISEQLENKGAFTLSYSNNEGKDVLYQTFEVTVFLNKTGSFTNVVTIIDDNSESGGGETGEVLVVIENESDQAEIKLEDETKNDTTPEDKTKNEKKPETKDDPTTTSPKKIEDEPTPLDPSITESTTDIPDEDVPMDNLPKTGVTGIAHYVIIGLLAALMMALTGWSVNKTRRTAKGNI